MASNTGQRLPITTYLGHVDRALDFYKSNSIYFALGKPTPWDGEVLDSSDNPDFIPPEPDINATTLDDLVCLKKVSQKLLVCPDDSGELSYDGQNWAILSEEEAIKRKSRWVYITATLQYNEVELTEYRQVGIFNRTIVSSEYQQSSLVLPHQVENLGLLIALNNRYRVTRQVDTRDTYSLIIEF